MSRNQSTSPCWLEPDDSKIAFPDVELALRDPDGLLAMGGKLSVEWLLQAYRRGIFPWYGPGQPILWWAPDPRLVLLPEKLHLSRSLAKTIRQKKFTVTLDSAFSEVIAACAHARPAQSGTWITREMQAAYIDLHHKGYAHSAECWYDGKLAGGLYGVAVGNIFYGESMFTAVTDASKVAFVALVRQLKRWGFSLIDCQIHTEHLASLGASMIPRKDFTAILNSACGQHGRSLPWEFDDH
jgi:leucyl/phenylalanyl-tRNA--protein transferase